MATLFQISLFFAAVWYAWLPTSSASRRVVELTLRSGDQLFMRFLESIYPAGHDSQLSRAEMGQPAILTPFIQNGRYDAALQMALVNKDALTSEIESYAGYLTVDLRHNSNLWFWYFPVKGKPIEETPLIVWLPGMPGVSSLDGLFTEMGPYSVSETVDGSIVYERPQSWGKDHSLLFIDSPVGSGFSFTDSEEGYATTESTVATHLHSALEQFLLLFPGTRKAPLVLAGGGLAGKYIASLANLIHTRADISEHRINLQVLIIGSGFLDPASMLDYSHYAAELGLVDADGADAMRASELLADKALKDGNPELAYNLWTNTINILIENSKIRNLYNYADDQPAASHLYLDKIEEVEVRKALHVGNVSFTRLGKAFSKLEGDFMRSARESLEQALEHYRVLCYGGQLDVLMAYPLSARLYETLFWSGSEDYWHSRREKWYHNEQLAGYYKTAGKFTEVMVRAAGHMMSADQPERVLALISAFIAGIGLKDDTATSSHDADYDLEEK